MRVEYVVKQALPHPVHNELTVEGPILCNNAESALRGKFQLLNPTQHKFQTLFLIDAVECM
jgi:hypothetical protein